MPSPLNSPTADALPRSLYEAFAEIDVLDTKRSVVGAHHALNVNHFHSTERTCCSPISTTSGSNSSCSIHRDDHDPDPHYSCESLDKSSSVDSSTDASTTSVLPARCNIGSIRYRRAKLNLNLLPLSIGIGSAPDMADIVANSDSVNSVTSNNALPLNLPLSQSSIGCERGSLQLQTAHLGGSGGLRRNRPTYSFFMNKSLNHINAVQIDPTIVLERQRWFHGHINRIEAEMLLESCGHVGAYLVRICDQRTRAYSISLKSFRGFMHIRVKKDETSSLYSLCQNRSSPDQFGSVPELIQYYTTNRLPISGAEFMSLVFPVDAQLL